MKYALRNVYIYSHIISQLRAGRMHPCRRRVMGPGLIVKPQYL